MKGFLSLFMLLFFTATFTHTLGWSDVEIETPSPQDCVSGWINLHVEVKVKGEIFNFYPSCNFYFHENFQTSKGLRCRIESGMCSGFFPSEEIEVDCWGEWPERHKVLCP